MWPYEKDIIQAWHQLAQRIQGATRNRWMVFYGVSSRKLEACFADDPKRAPWVAESRANELWAAMMAEDLALPWKSWQDIAPDADPEPQQQSVGRSGPLTPARSHSIRKLPRLGLSRRLAG